MPDPWGEATRVRSIPNTGFRVGAKVKIGVATGIIIEILYEPEYISEPYIICVSRNNLTTGRPTMDGLINNRKWYALRDLTSPYDENDINYWKGG